MDFVSDSNAKLAASLGIDNVEVINEATGHPLKTMKISLAIVRRIKKLAKLQSDGKIDLPE
jgi:predicted homoserine dehydrogenase-like protein